MARVEVWRRRTVPDLGKKAVVEWLLEAGLLAAITVEAFRRDMANPDFLAIIDGHIDRLRGLRDRRTLKECPTTSSN